MLKNILLKNGSFVNFSPPLNFLFPGAAGRRLAKAGVLDYNPLAKRPGPAFSAMS
jgi:hypothetical protein